MKSSLYLLLHHFLHQLLISHIRHRDIIAVCMRTVKLLARLHGMRIACPRTAGHTTHHIPQHSGTQDFVYPLTAVAHHAETAVDGFSDTYATSIVQGQLMPRAQFPAKHCTAISAMTLLPSLILDVSRNGESVPLTS